MLAYDTLKKILDPEVRSRVYSHIEERFLSGLKTEFYLTEEEIGWS